MLGQEHLFYQPMKNEGSVQETHMRTIIFTIPFNNSGAKITQIAQNIAYIFKRLACQNIFFSYLFGGKICGIIIDSIIRLVENI